MVESVSQSESCGFGTILDVLRLFLCVSVMEHWILLREHYCKKKNWLLKQAVDVAVSMELVETEVSKRKGPWYSVHTMV